MADQLGALGLVLNAIVLWTTRSTSTPPSPGFTPKATRSETRTSPLKHRNLNLLGRSIFTATTPAAGALRPLRDPDVPELDEGDDGGQE